jgi:hypothetical protein
MSKREVAMTPFCPKCGAKMDRWVSDSVKWSCGSWRKADGTESWTLECHARRHDLQATNAAMQERD